MNVIYKMKFSVRLWIRSGDFNFSKSFLLFFFLFFLSSFASLRFDFNVCVGVVGLVIHRYALTVSLV